MNARRGGFLSVGRLTARVENKERGTGEGRTGIDEQPPFPIPNHESPTHDFVIRTPTAVFTAWADCAGRDIPRSTEFGVALASPEVSRAYVFRGWIAVQTPGGGTRDRIKVPPNTAVAVQQDEEGRRALIVCDESRPNPDLFAHRIVVPLAGDRQQVAWLKDVGAGPARHFAAVGTGEDLVLPLPAARKSGHPGRTEDEAALATGVTYTCRLSFDLGGVVPGTAMLRARYFAYNYVTAVRLNGKGIAPSHNVNPRAIKEGGELLSREGFVPGLNVLEIDVNNSGTSGLPDDGGMLWLRPELSGIRPPIPPPASREGPG